MEIFPWFLFRGITAAIPIFDRGFFRTFFYFLGRNNEKTSFRILSENLKFSNIPHFFFLTSPIQKKHQNSWKCLNTQNNKNFFFHQNSIFWVSNIKNYSKLHICLQILAPDMQAKSKFMQKSYDHLLKKFLAFISPMNRKFISKIERGDSFWRSLEPLKLSFSKIWQLVFLVIASKKTKKKFEKSHDQRLILPLWCL